MRLHIEKNDTFSRAQNIVKNIVKNIDIRISILISLSLCGIPNAGASNDHFFKIKSGATWCERRKCPLANKKSLVTWRIQRTCARLERKIARTWENVFKTLDMSTFTPKMNILHDTCGQNVYWRQKKFWLMWRLAHLCPCPDALFPLASCDVWRVCTLGWTEFCQTNSNPY